MSFMSGHGVLRIRILELGIWLNESMVTYMNSDKRYVGLTIWSLLFTRHLYFDWDM